VNRLVPSTGSVLRCAGESVPRVIRRTFRYARPKAHIPKRSSKPGRSSVSKISPADSYAVARADEAVQGNRSCRSRIACTRAGASEGRRRGGRGWKSRVGGRFAYRVSANGCRAASGADFQPYEAPKVIKALPQRVWSMSRIQYLVFEQCNHVLLAERRAFSTSTYGQRIRGVVGD